MSRANALQGRQAATSGPCCGNQPKQESALLYLARTIDISEARLADEPVGPLMMRRAPTEDEHGA